MILRNSTKPTTNWRDGVRPQYVLPASCVEHGRQPASFKNGKPERIAQRGSPRPPAMAGAVLVGLCAFFLCAPCASAREIQPMILAALSTDQVAAIVAII